VRRLDRLQFSVHGLPSARPWDGWNAVRVQVARGRWYDLVIVEGQVRMTVANFKIGKRSFVVVPARDFDRMRRESERYRRLANEDKALAALAEKELRAFRKASLSRQRVYCNHASDVC
jgi:hypothetical protein